MISTHEMRQSADVAKRRALNAYGQRVVGDLLEHGAETIDQLRTTLQHATEDKAKTLAVLQQLHMKRANPHNTQELLEFYLEAHLLIRNLLNGVPMEADNRG